MSSILKENIKPRQKVIDDKEKVEIEYIDGE